MPLTKTAVSRVRHAIAANLTLALLCGAMAASPATALAQSDLCGDASGNGEIEAGDALIALQVAVGIRLCPLPRCDCNASGVVTASDAMDILKSAVGLDVVLQCPSPIVTTTSTTTSTTLAELCGNGEFDEGEDCDSRGWFCRGACSANCECVP